MTDREVDRRIAAVCIVIVLVFLVAMAGLVVMPTAPKHNVKNVFYTDSVLPAPHFVSMNGDPLDGVISAVPLSLVRMQINYTAHGPSGCDVSDAQPSTPWGYSCSGQVQTFYTTMNSSSQTLTVRAAGIDTAFNVALLIPIGQRLDYGFSGALEANIVVHVPLVTNILWRYNSTRQNVVILPLAVYPYAIGNPDTKHPFEVIIDMRVSYPNASMGPDADYPQFLLATQRDYDTVQRGYGVNSIIIFTQSWCESGLRGCYHYAAPAKLDAQYFILIVNGIHGINMNIEVSAAFIEYFPPS